MVFFNEGFPNSVLNVKALVGAFKQEKALVGAFSVIVQPVVEPMEHYTALLVDLHDVIPNTLDVVVEVDHVRGLRFPEENGINLSLSSIPLLELTRRSPRCRVSRP